MKIVKLGLAATVAALATLAAMATAPALAQTPKKGGILNFAIVAEPPTTDCHASTTFATLHPVAPQYSTLLKFSGPHDKQKIVGDLAESWEMSKDGLTFTFKTRRGVKWHDGSPFSSADIKATYERIVRPPQGVVSARQAVHEDIGEITTPDDATVIFKLKRPNASMILHFASPFNCVYSAAKLAIDPNYPAKDVMGTGAFKFVEYVKGSHWVGTRFDQYHEPNKPYLDGFKAYFVKSGAVVTGIRGGQFDAEFRGRTPAERDQLVAAMKDQVTVVEGPWTTNILLTFNTEHKPFDDVRVRKALTLAIDRWGGSENLGKVTLIKGVGGVFRPGAPWGLSTEELKAVPGFWPDINKSREEAKRLLKEAGVSNLKVKLVNRTIDQPFTPAGIYAIDQWKRIGVETEHVQVETKAWFDAMYGGTFDCVIQNISDFTDDPNAQFNTLLSKNVSAIAYSRHTDTKIDEMYARQSATVDDAERNKIVKDLERYTLEQAYNIPLLWYQRIVVNHRKVKGWDLPPSHFGGQTLTDVWLDQ